MTTWLIVAIVLALLGVGIWYARARGWIQIGALESRPIWERSLPPAVAQRVRERLGPLAFQPGSAANNAALIGPQAQNPGPWPRVTGLGSGRASITGQPGEPLPNATLMPQ